MPADSNATATWVPMGRVSGLFGVHGWVKVYSYTEPRSGITGYDPVYLNTHDGWQAFKVEDGRSQSKSIVLKFVGYDDRGTATTLLDCDIAVRREQLPELAPGEFYWADLHGLRVVTAGGVDLGKVDRLFATGANDVMLVKDERERLIPFIQGDVVTEVDLDEGIVRVDWDPDF